MENKTYNNLMELTGRESGIIIYPNKASILCNWSSIEGLPKLLAGTLIGLGEPIDEPKEIRELTGREMKKQLTGTKVEYDINGDFINIVIDDNINNNNMSYMLPDGTQIITPNGWH